MKPASFAVIKGIVAAFTGWWVSVPLALQTLFWLSVLDVVSSLFSPHRSITQTIRRVVLAILLAATVFYLYGLAKAQSGLNLGFDLGSAVCMFYAVGEAVQVAKNFNEAGVGFPPVILNLLAKADGLTTGERNELDALKLKQQQESEALELKHEQTKDLNSGAGAGHSGSL